MSPLIKEPVIAVKPSAIRTFGANRAIVIQQIRYYSATPDSSGEVGIAQFSLEELGWRCGLNKGQTWRAVQWLSERGFIEYVGEEREVHQYVVHDDLVEEAAVAKTRQAEQQRSVAKTEQACRENRTDLSRKRDRRRNIPIKEKEEENRELSVAAETATPNNDETERPEATQAAEHFAQQFNTYHARRNGDSVKVKPRWVTDMDRLLRIGGKRSSKAGADVQVDPPQDLEHLKRVITAMFERLTDNTNGRIAWADTISSPSGLRANWGAIRDALNATRQTNTDPIVESAHTDECCGPTPGWVRPEWNNNDPTVIRPCPGITQLRETSTTTEKEPTNA